MATSTPPNWELACEVGGGGGGGGGGGCAGQGARLQDSAGIPAGRFVLRQQPPLGP